MDVDSTHNIEQEKEPIVLIVDDVPANLSLLFDYLNQEGFRVLVAQSGRNALLQTQRLKPDIILLDVMMPGMDGFETCELLKANPEMCEIPVIFLTAMDDPYDKVRGFELGGVDYITKPIQEVEVLARLRTHLAINDLQNRLKAQLDFTQKLVKERNAQLAQTNQEFTRLNGSYQTQIAQQEQERIEKDKLFTIITQQTEQWRMLSTFLVGQTDTAGQELTRELNDQVLQNLGLVSHSLYSICESLEKNGSLDPSHLSHLRQASQMLESSKSYLEKANQVKYKPKVSPDALSTLTPREQDVFQLLVDGKSTSEISRILLLTEGSIRTYRNRIMKKLELPSFTALIKFAIKHGLTELD